MFHKPAGTLRRIAPFAIALLLLPAACTRGRGSSEPVPQTATPTPTLLPVGLNRGGSDAPDEVSTDGLEGDPTVTPTPESSACLLDTWEVDNASYLAFLQTTTQGAPVPGDFTDVSGVLRITFDNDGTITNMSEGFETTMCGPDGCLTLPYSHSGTSSYRAEDGQLIVEGGQFVTTSIGGISGQAETTENRALYTCSASTLVLEMDGFPPLRWTRVLE
jgi:hypothetical protein